MSKKIIFQKCNFNNIYFLFYIISRIIQYIVEYYFKSEYLKVDSEKKYSSSNRMLSQYFYAISDLLSFIPYLISNRLSKNKKRNLLFENKEADQYIKLIYNNEMKSKSRRKKIIFYLIIISVIYFLSNFMLDIFTFIFPDKGSFLYNFDSTAPCNIIFQFISSYLILKMHFNKLQYFSLFIAIIIFIIILILDIIIIINYEITNGYIYLFFFISLLFLTIVYALGKKIILKSFISIYFLLFMRGIFTFIISIIYSIIIYFINKDILIQVAGYLDSKEEILIEISYIIILFFDNIFLWIIIDKFSPNYVPFAFIFEELSYFTVDIIKKKDFNRFNILGWDFYIRIFLYIILIFSIMIHNQIIIINICGLGSETKYFLQLKFENEELYADTEDSEILQRFETMNELDDKNININNI